MLKIGVVILTILLIYSGVYVIMAIFTPKTVAKGAFKTITGKELDSVQDAGYLKALIDRQRSLGVFALTSVISCFFILFVGFRKAQRWAWWAFLFVSGIGYLWGIIHNIVNADTLNIVLMAVGLAILLLGLLIPVKAFFSGVAEEA
jgi:hypothetical protein